MNGPSALNTAPLQSWAEAIVDYLNDNVLEVDVVSLPDLLDTLASTNLTLAVDHVGLSSLLYYEIIAGETP